VWWKKRTFASIVSVLGTALAIAEVNEGAESATASTTHYCILNPTSRRPKRQQACQLDLISQLEALKNTFF
jgi:hypothetical protein